MDRCIVKSSDVEAIIIAPREGNLYKINFVNVNDVNATNLVQSLTGDDTLKLWHHRLGYLNVKGVYKLQNMVSGMNLGKKNLPHNLVGL